MLSSGVIRRETANGFYPWGKVDSPRKRVADGIVWLAAWKLVSNDAKRTVAPPNAKHTTLLQGCFLCFCFCAPNIYPLNHNHCPSNFPLGQNTSPQKSKKSAPAEDESAFCEGWVYIKMKRRLNQAPQSRRIE